MTTKRIFSGSALIVMSIAFLAPAVSYGAEGEFVIDADGEYPESVDTSAFWTNSLGRRDLTSGLWEGTPYSGIAITSIDMPDNLTLYIKDYNGPDTYPLLGTGDVYEYAYGRNAVYSHDEPKVPYMVVKKSDGGSYVEITEDRDGLLSGIYELKLYMDGSAQNPSMELSGHFISLGPVEKDMKTGFTIENRAPAPSASKNAPPKARNAPVPPEKKAELDRLDASIEVAADSVEQAATSSAEQVADANRRELVKREAELAQREMELARRERELAQREAEKAAAEKRAQLEREKQRQLRLSNIAGKWTFVAPKQQRQWMEVKQSGERVEFIHHSKYLGSSQKNVTKGTYRDGIAHVTIKSFPKSYNYYYQISNDGMHFSFLKKLKSKKGEKLKFEKTIEIYMQRAP